MCQYSSILAHSCCSQLLMRSQARNQWLNLTRKRFLLTFVLLKWWRPKSCLHGMRRKQEMGKQRLSVHKTLSRSFPVNESRNDEWHLWTDIFKCRCMILYALLPHSGESWTLRLRGDHVLQKAHVWQVVWADFFLLWGCYWNQPRPWRAQKPFCVPHFLFVGNRLHSNSMTFPESKRADSNSCSSGK